MATYTKVYNNPYPDGWKDGKDGATPVTADILNNQTETFEAIEQYLSNNPIEDGGGTGGTTDYEALDNKPSINGVELSGNKTTADLGIETGGTDDYEKLNNKPTINGVEVIGDLSLDDLGITVGGESGTTDYNDLENKPIIEGIELNGNITLNDLSTKKQIRISWADYQALSTEEKNDTSVVYFVHDYPENTITASNVVYDNATSGLESTETQGAIDELNEKVNAKAEQSTVDTLTEKVIEGELKTVSGTSIHVIDAKDAPCLVNPYGNTTQNGTPTPDTPIAIESTVISEIRTCRKNLFKLQNTMSSATGNGITITFNNDKSITLNGTSTARATFPLGTVKLKAGKYVLSQGYITNSNSACIFGAYKKADGTQVYIDLFSRTSDQTAFTLTEDVEMDIRADVRNAGITVSNVTLYPMLELDTVATDFEPYTETVATLPEPITLNGIGDVKDYIDMKRGEEVENCYVKVFDGTENITFASLSTGGGSYFLYADENIKYAASSAQVTGSFCNYLTEKTSNYLWANNEVGFSIDSKGAQFRFRFPESITTVAQAQAWLAEKYAEGNPFTVVVPRAEPIITPLSEANIKALRELRSFNGITNVYNNASAEMDFMYASTDNAAINMENNNKFGDFITIVKAETTLENASSGNFQTMLSNIIPDGYKLVGITNIYAQDSDGELVGQVRVQANVQSVGYANNIVVLNCNVYTGTSNPINGTITFEFLMIKR